MRLTQKLKSRMGVDSQQHRISTGLFVSCLSRSFLRTKGYRKARVYPSASIRDWEESRSKDDGWHWAGWVTKLASSVLWFLLLHKFLLLLPSLWTPHQQIFGVNSKPSFVKVETGFDNHCSQNCLDSLLPLCPLLLRYVHTLLKNLCKFQRSDI